MTTTLTKDELISLKDLKHKVYAPNAIVIIKYAGSGDSGGIEEVYYDTDENEPIDNIEEALTHFGYRLLETHFAGWEINDGSSGEICIDFGAESVTWSHDDYYLESHRTTLAGGFGDERRDSEKPSPQNG